ncbi:ABC transporter permease (plasmid) [Arthrobacter sp. KN11-1C]|uniref:ABC transporter permease n=1 Tax=Arthrobacter sp. KN11-1C TaxID=3445774 RepID=UPI003FA14BC6
MDRWSNWAGRAVLVFLYLPIVAVVVYSFNDSPAATDFRGFTLRWYVALAHNEALLSSLRTSLLVAVLAASFATAVGLAAALGLARKGLPGQKIMLGAIILPLVVPEIVLGAALLSLFSALHLTLGFGTLVLGHLVITLPMATLVLLGAARALDPSLADAAADLGCTPWETFRRVTFPLLLPSIGAAWLLSFVTSFGNIVLSTFTNGVGTTTLPLRIFSLVKNGLTPEINALGSVLIVATITIVLIVGAQQLRRILAPASAPETPVPPTTT